MMRERSTCRSCGSNRTDLVLSLGEPSLSTFPLPGEDPRRAPLDMLLCSECSLVQLGHVYPGDWFYSWYGYRSGTNPMMVQALYDLGKAVCDAALLEAGDSVLDIGSNDGTFLRNLPVLGLRCVGCDPAKNLGPEAGYGLDLFINDYFSAAAVEPFIKQHGKFKAVTATAMFYHLEDPISFLEQIQEVIARTGILSIQMNYLGQMLIENGYDNIVHEHQTYFSLTSLLPVMQAGGFDVLDVAQNDINGGSFRILCTPNPSARPWTSQGRRNIESMLAREADLQLDKQATYLAFAKRVRQLRSDLRTLITHETELRKKIYVYGASTRGLSIMEYCGLNSDLIAGAAERNADKIGRQYGTTGITCIPENEARSKADYFLILPHHFLPSFIEREKEWLASGGQFIVPLPRVRIVSAQGVEIRDAVEA